MKEPDAKTIKYDKLIRDLIPDICNEDGKIAITKELDEHEYKRYLEEKLLEECHEYIESRSLDELADVLEVIHALAEINGKAFEDIEKLRILKKRERGGFRKRLLLVETRLKELSMDRALVIK